MSQFVVKYKLGDRDRLFRSAVKCISNQTWQLQLFSSSFLSLWWWKCIKKGRDRSQLCSPHMSRIDQNWAFACKNRRLKFQNLDEYFKSNWEVKPRAADNECDLHVKRFWCSDWVWTKRWLWSLLIYLFLFNFFQWYQAMLSQWAYLE